MRPGRIISAALVLVLFASGVALAALSNPIPARIAPDGYAVSLLDVATFPATSTTATAAQGRALVNAMATAGDGSGRLFVNDSRGPVHIVSGGSLLATPFLDMRTLRPGAFVGTAKQGGLRSIAFHPDYAKAGAPGAGRLYTIATETPESAAASSVVLPFPAPALFHDVVTEWRVDPNDRNRVDPASRREIVRIPQPMPDHSADTLAFDRNAAPGTAGYGKMFVTVGDGGNNPPDPDPYRVAQNGAYASGKILRIDPLRPAGGRPYTVPGDNPFVGRAGFLPEIYALGLRHPAAISFDRGGTGTCILTDIGQAAVEEVNLCRSGANYGWREREGTFATEPTGEGVNPLPAGDAAFGFTYPVAQYDHDEAPNRVVAVTGGHVYRGSAAPNLVGQYIFGDMVTGRLFHVPVGALAVGRQATIGEVTIIAGGVPKTLLSIVGGTRTDLRLGEGEDGEMYVLTKQDGKLRKIVPHGRWTGTAGADTRNGSAYGDNFDGAGGNDTLTGAAGPDWIRGGAGADVITGGPGYDILLGDAGADRFIVNQPSESGYGSADQIVDFVSGTDRLVLRGLGSAPRYIGTAAFIAGGPIEVRFNAATKQVQIDANNNGSFGTGDAAVKVPNTIAARDVLFS